MKEDMSAVEVHVVRNGWMVHPSRGWLDRGDTPTWDDRIWVFNAFEDLCGFLKGVHAPTELPKAE